MCSERHYMCYKRRNVLKLSRMRSLVSYEIRWGQSVVSGSEEGMVIESQRSLSSRFFQDSLVLRGF
jgi:hypothetical protein